MNENPPLCKCEHSADEHDPNCQAAECSCEEYVPYAGGYGYPWDNIDFVRAAKKAVEARRADAERAEEFMRAMNRELRKKAKNQMADDPFKNGWCFCPKCSHLRSGEKPWKNPTCSVCNSTGKVSVEVVCPYRICGRLREECICPTQKVELPMTDRSAIDVLKDPPKLITQPLDKLKDGIVNAIDQMRDLIHHLDAEKPDQQEAFQLGEETMRSKVIAFLEQRADDATEAAKANKFIRREAMALSEAAELIKRGKEIPGGFDA